MPAVSSTPDTGNSVTITLCSVSHGKTEKQSKGGDQKPSSGPQPRRGLGFRKDIGAVVGLHDAVLQTGLDEQSRTVEVPHAAGVQCRDG